MPEIHVIMEIPHKYVAVLFRQPLAVPSMMPESLESSPPNTGIAGSNPRGLMYDNQKGYIGSWIYPEYFVTWLIHVVGFDC